MTIYLDTTTSPTGRRLAGSGIFTLWSDNSRAGRGDVILKWGRGLGGYPRAAKVLNPVICSDKLYQGQKLADAGVAYPKQYASQEAWEADGYPDLVKKPREGEGGRGIVKCTRRSNRPRWDYGNIYQLYINKAREFRALQIGDLTAYIMEKFPPNGDRGTVCWNLHQGAEWHRLSSGERALSTKINTLASKALKAVHYDFGGVDLVLDEDDKLYVLECNSRPGLGPENLQLFVRTLKQFCDNL